MNIIQLYYVQIIYDIGVEGKSYAFLFSLSMTLEKWVPRKIHTELSYVTLTLIYYTHEQGRILLTFISCHPVTLSCTVLPLKGCMGIYLTYFPLTSLSFSLSIDRYIDIIMKNKRKQLCLFVLKQKSIRHIYL